MRNSLGQAGYLDECRKYCPSLTLDDLLPYEAGIRAQAVRRDGTLEHDFLSPNGRTLHVCNAPSPAATSALPIGRMIAERAAAQRRHLPTVGAELEDPGLNSLIGGVRGVLHEHARRGQRGSGARRLWWWEWPSAGGSGRAGARSTRPTTGYCGSPSWPARHRCRTPRRPLIDTSPHESPPAAGTVAWPPAPQAGAVPSEHRLSERSESAPKRRRRFSRGCPCGPPSPRPRNGWGRSRRRPASSPTDRRRARSGTGTPGRCGAAW